MSLTDKRIDNIMKVMRKAKHYDMKVIWNDKLQKLFEHLLVLQTCFVLNS